jgi:transcriptional regulator with XRE-family HTH domain
MKGDMLKMENNNFDLFEGINLSEDDKKYFNEQKEVSNYIIKLIKRRIELKMSQRDLAKKTGIKQPMIARIERFDTTPRFDTLLKIANALDLRLDFEKNINININLSVNINVNYKVEETNIYQINDQNINSINLANVS